MDILFLSQRWYYFIILYLILILGAYALVVLSAFSLEKFKNSIIAYLTIILSSALFLISRTLGAIGVILFFINIIY